MNGQTVLRSVASALESIDPEDRFCPFCYLLLRTIRPLLKESPEPGGLDDQVVEVVHEDGTRDRDLPQPPGPVLRKVVGLDTEG